MLFRIEKDEKQDWESLKSIKELVTKAQETVIDGNYKIVKNLFLPNIKKVIYSSSDVTKNDRRNMVLKIEQHLRELGLQATKVQKRSLYSIMQRPLPQINAAIEAELVTLEKLFEQPSN